MHGSVLATKWQNFNNNIRLTSTVSSNYKAEIYSCTAAVGVFLVVSVCSVILNSRSSSKESLSSAIWLPPGPMVCTVFPRSTIVPSNLCSWLGLRSQCLNFQLGYSLPKPLTRTSISCISTSSSNIHYQNVWFGHPLPGSFARIIRFKTRNIIRKPKYHQFGHSFARPLGGIFTFKTCGQGLDIHLQDFWLECLFTFKTYGQEC